MQRRVDPPLELLALAKRQSGVLSTEQAFGFGLTRRPLDRLIAAGHWRHLARGIYQVHTQEPPWLAWAWGGILLGGAGSRLGGLAAGHLHELNDPPDALEVLVPSSTPLAPRGPWSFVRERPGVRSARSPGEPPRLPIEDTVLDLTERGDEAHVVDLIMRAIQSRRTTHKRLALSASTRRRLRHRGLLEELLGDVAQGAESVLELRFLRDVERPHGLPRGKRQHRAAYGPFRQDVRYDEFGLVVELDGRLGHEGVERFRDMFRDNAGVMAGQLTLRYGWIDTTQRPCSMAFQIAGVLSQRGWLGVPHCCDRCEVDPEIA